MFDDRGENPGAAFAPEAENARTSGDPGERKARKPASGAPAALQEARPAEKQERPSGDKADAQPEGDQNKAPAKSPSRRRRLVALGLLLAVVIGAGGYVYWDQTSHFETTDDAFIAARQSSIAPRVTGYVVAVPVTDNEHVVAGQTIARIDDRDYRIALAQAEAQVGAAQAAVGNIDAQIDAQRAQIDASQAQVDQAQATLVFAQQQAARYKDLEKTGAGSVQNEQQYISQLHQQQAALETAQANLKLAQRQVDTLNAQRKTAEANLAEARARRDQARLNLSYTTVTAAEPGRIVNLGAAVGALAQPGTSLAMFVPDDVWVTANFKETQLDHMRPGQPATISIDAYPERDFHGHVASVQPGSGPAFSLLPPENATGNFVKIVQRVPVKIIIDNPPTDVALGPGMSVEPTVRINPSPSLYERLKARL